MDTLNKFLSFEIMKIGDYHLKVYALFSVLLIIFGTKLLLFLIRKGLLKNSKFNKLDQGSAFALFQVIRYFVWIFSIIFIMDSLGVKITVLLTSSTALFVGIGLGLQATFIDFISGLVLLIEGKTKVGDILEVNGEVLQLKSIGIRTSEAINRDNIVYFVPNSKLTNDKVINWNHQSDKVRFKIKVGVAYGSDVDLVLKVLKESALEHKNIVDQGKIDVWFTDFGSSSLNFELLFYSENIFRIEKVKSEIRIIINRKFIENNITIPFPQMDIHINNK
jgi:small-conductance mechanosensitive channel